VSPRKKHRKDAEGCQLVGAREGRGKRDQSNLGPGKVRRKYCVIQGRPCREGKGNIVSTVLKGEVAKKREG